MGPQ